MRGTAFDEAASRQPKRTKRGYAAYAAAAAILSAQRCLMLRKFSPAATPQPRRVPLLVAQRREPAASAPRFHRACDGEVQPARRNAEE